MLVSTCPGRVWGLQWGFLNQVGQGCSHPASLSPSPAPNLSGAVGRIFCIAGGKKINLLLTGPPGSANNVPGAAQSPELPGRGSHAWERPPEKLGSRKIPDSLHATDTIKVGLLGCPNSRGCPDDLGVNFLEEEGGQTATSGSHTSPPRGAPETRSLCHLPQHSERHLSIKAKSCLPMLNSTASLHLSAKLQSPGKKQPRRISPPQGNRSSYLPSSRNAPPFIPA